MKTKEITYTGLSIALVFVVTRFIQIPIPLGYFNIGNTVILLLCLVFDSPIGILAGSIGSALADVTSYPVYTIPTFIIKAIMPILFYSLNKKMNKNISAGIVTLIPLFGYTVTGMILYSSISMGITQFPGLLLEYIANLIFFSVLSNFIKVQKKTS